MVRELILILLVLVLLPSIAMAAVTVSISQSGADSGTVMAGRTFTITASGWSGSCNSANLDLSNCPVCNVSESQSKTISGSSVSWTTLTASKANSQSITVSVSGTCTPDSGSVSFDVKNPPSLSATVSPSSTNVTQGSTFTISLNIQNNGETTARFGSITVSPSDFSISSGCSPSDISGGQSVGISCTIRASSSATTGSRTLSVLISPSNADSITKTVTVTVNAAPTEEVTPGRGAGAGGIPGIANITVATTRGAANITIPSIAAGKMAIVNITKTVDMAITQITISVKNSVNNIKITITKLPGKPAEVTIEVEGKVYHYIQIDKKNIKDTDINKTLIRFRVEKSWISQNNIDANAIALYRYANGKWDKLLTTKVSEDTSDIYFEGESPSLSVFAISGAVAAEAPRCPACPEPSAWSECIKGKKTRTNYRCSAATNYMCQAYTQEDSCISLPEILPELKKYILLFVMILIVVVGIVVFLVWKKTSKPLVRP